MKKLRSKIILILTLTVVLPIIPISVLVYNLVNQSYQIGVNFQVEKALKNGLDLSRELYNYQRKDLAKTLETIETTPNLSTSREILVEKIKSSADTMFWQFYSLQYFNASREKVWDFGFTDRDLEPIDKLYFSQFQLPDQKDLVVSQRDKNLYTAIRKIEKEKKLSGYLILQTGLKPAYKDRVDHLLQVHQIYQTLDLAKGSLLKSYLYVFIVLSLFVLIIVVLAGIWVSSKITAPVSLLVKGTSEIGEGNLDFRLPELKRKDELGQLVKHFNEMAQQLKENQERMIYLEKMAAWQLMARKIAHEIKNPLTPIQLTIQQLVDKYDGKDGDYGKLLKECSSIINEEIGSLRKLVSEFSEFGKLPELKLESGNLNELIQEISLLYGERVYLQLDQNLQDFPFDHDRLRRVIINLLENAVQADQKNQPITIRSQFNHDKIRLEIEDKGEGIEAEDLQKIFEPYFSTKKRGTGLGLAISRLIVEEHNGTIRFDSKVGEGTVVTIELPLFNI
jgi:nitrogen fixation/metabolism regulation signal transduction histidine kinase